MATVDYLGGRSGVQYDGIQIEEDANGVDLQNVLLVGEFKRGPFNRPFKVTKETMEAKLSFDYNNPYYTFLEDAFAHGAEYIWVMRVSREQVVEPEPIWGDWILNSGVTVNTSSIAHYTAYKTNQREYYDSYANLDLTAAIVRSLHDGDMQQWQAVKDAANDLTGNSTWLINIDDSTLDYSVNALKNCSEVECFGEYIWYPDTSQTNGVVTYYSSHNLDLAKQLSIAFLMSSGYYTAVRNVSEGSSYPYQSKVIYSYDAEFLNKYGSWESRPGVGIDFTYKLNPAYDQSKSDATDYKIPLLSLATKIITNASSSNEAISLLAEAYLEAVANSIFNADESEQFVKLLDIEPDFEANKTQR